MSLVIFDNHVVFNPKIFIRISNYIDQLLKLRWRYCIPYITKIKVCYIILYPNIPVNLSNCTKLCPHNTSMTVLTWWFDIDRQMGYFMCFIIGGCCCCLPWSDGEYFCLGVLGSSGAPDAKCNTFTIKLHQVKFGGMILFQRLVTCDWVTWSTLRLLDNFEMVITKRQQI